MELIGKITYPFRFIPIMLIRTYQVLLSPDHSWLRSKFPYGYCRHYPTCSEYSRLAFLRYGIMKGSWLAVIRILKCNPWSQPKIDLISN